MSYFSQDFIDFFKDLAANNNKDWFHANKKRYETSIKKPFEVFLTDLIGEIQKYDASVQVAPKDCLGRINRDIRFSKDKTPYNTHYTAYVSSVGKKDKSVPGIYLRFTPEEIGIMGGSYGLTKEQLQKARTGISNDLVSFQKVINAKDFKSEFETIRGEEHKRIPAEFQETYKKEPLIAKKQFYFYTMRPAELITSDDLMSEIMSVWQKAHPVNTYLKSIL